MNPFDFVNSINDTKKNLIEEDPLCEKDYTPFMTNRALSYFYDTIFLSNEMNRHHHLSKKMQYEFLLKSVPKKKRFSKWHKGDKHEDVDLISREYGYSKVKALEVVDLLTPNQLKEIKDKYSIGGR